MHRLLDLIVTDKESSMSSVACGSGLLADTPDEGFSDTCTGE